MKLKTHKEHNVSLLRRPTG